MPQIILTYLALFKWKIFARCCFILRQNESAFGNLKCFSEVKEPLCSAVPRVELQSMFRHYIWRFCLWLQQKQCQSLLRTNCVHAGKLDCARTHVLALCWIITVFNLSYPPELDGWNFAACWECSLASSINPEPYRSALGSSHLLWAKIMQGNILAI